MTRIWYFIPKEVTHKAIIQSVLMEHIQASGSAAGTTECLQ